MIVRIRMRRRRRACGRGGGDSKQEQMGQKEALRIAHQYGFPRQCRLLASPASAAVAPAGGRHRTPDIRVRAPARRRNATSAMWHADVRPGVHGPRPFGLEPANRDANPAVLWKRRNGIGARRHCPALSMHPIVRSHPSRCLTLTAAPGLSRSAALLLFAAAVVLWPGRPAPAQQLPRPFAMTVGAGATYDDNLFRLPAGQTPTGLRSASRSDFFWNAFVDGQAYLPVSRQVLRAGLTLATNGYQNYSFLNYQAVNGSAAWDWRIGSRFSGTLSYTQLQALSSFIDLRSFVRNINTVRIASAENEFWMLPDWHLTAGVASTRVDNSDEALSFAKLDETAADAGIKYVTYAQNYVKLYWREAWGKYPDQQVVAGSFFDNRYDQTDVTLEYFQAPTGASQVIARLAYTERRSPNLPQRNFSGPTGRLSWVYAAR